MIITSVSELELRLHYMKYTSIYKGWNHYFEIYKNPNVEYSYVFGIFYEGYIESKYLKKLTYFIQTD